MPPSRCPCSSGNGAATTRGRMPSGARSPIAGRPIRPPRRAAAERSRSRARCRLDSHSPTSDKELKERAMPGLAGRFSTTVKAKISKLLDRAEDPAETLDYGYQKQVELL